MREGAEVVADQLNSRVPIGVWPRRWENVRIGHEADLNEEPLDGAVRDKPNESTERNRDESERKGNAPLTATDASHLERSAADEYDQNLYCDLCRETLVNDSPGRVILQRTDEGNDHEVVVLSYAFEYVEMIIETTRVDRVEDLREHEYVEDERLHDSIVMIRRRKIENA